MFMDTTPSSQSVICFGVFDAEVRTAELRKNGVWSLLASQLLRSFTTAP
jgi:hypothetical protein